MMKLTSKPILEMNFTELTQWWEDYKKEQKSWGGILVEPYPELLTTWYAERLIDGTIPASKENIQAAKRHMFNLSRQGTEAFPWVFDEELGHRPIRFIETYCKPPEGEYDTIVLQPWQHFIIGSLFGWINPTTKERLYRQAVEIVGRKNGKTTMQSGLSIYMAGFDGEKGANVYILANAKDQANLLFNKAGEMLKSSPKVLKQFKNKRSAIEHPATFSKIESRASDSRKLDGLNTHFAIFDEINEFRDYKLIEVIKKSRGTRKQPLIMYITTCGYVLDGPLMQYLENAKECLDNIEEDTDERTFYYVAKLDDPKEADDPEMWIKANPNIGLMQFVSLVMDWKQDKKVPQSKADWLTKQFNIMSDISEMSFVDIATINKNNRVIDIETLVGREAVGGYDLGETEDFSSACLEFPLDDGSIFILSHSWIPQARYDRDNNQQRLDEWIQDGYLTVLPGAYVDYEPILEWFKEKSKIYNIRKIAYDRAKALFLNGHLEKHGFVTEQVVQGFVTLGGAVQNFKELMLDGKVVFNNNKMFRWYLNNVKLVEDRNRNWLPKKQGKNRKIDGFAASLNSHVFVIPMLIKPLGKPKVTFISVSDLRNMR
ncbi:terminase large subunit [Heyndrickxia acidicola]|uniref:Terminase large subunit n=1 Tax=Heyndrickxia acidicola TaxID=209389 RepID=A0ABU6MMW0_9BACI|nr:terminase large subunit [Heyndrickxia acidicola]MED1205839.1 terminase large subunit [Heyndrickxia acidicola]